MWVIFVLSRVRTSLWASTVWLWSYFWTSCPCCDILFVGRSTTFLYLFLVSGSVVILLPAVTLAVEVGSLLLPMVLSCTGSKKMHFWFGYFPNQVRPPSPPGILKLFGPLSLGSFILELWVLFVSYFTKIRVQKYPKTFGFGQPPLLFYPKLQNRWCTWNPLPHPSPYGKYPN